MTREDWRARLVISAQAVLEGRQRCYDSDEGLNKDFDDVPRDALDRLAAVLGEVEK